MPANIRATIPKVAAPAQIPPNAVPSQYWGSANGQRVISGTLSLPLYGAWVADLVLQTTTALSGPVTLLVGNLTLVGAVYRQAVFAGLLECRLVAGAGGWSKSVGAVGYNNPAGVQASQVLSDAAAAVGETVVVAVPSTVGNQFARFGDSPAMPGKAGRVLRSVAGQQWWIDDAGVTHVGPRPSMPSRRRSRSRSSTAAQRHPSNRDRGSGVVAAGEHVLECDGRDPDDRERPARVRSGRRGPTRSHARGGLGAVDRVDPGADTARDRRLGAVRA